MTNLKHDVLDISRTFFDSINSNQRNGTAAEYTGDYLVFWGARIAVYWPSVPTPSLLTTVQLAYLVAVIGCHVLTSDPTSARCGS